MGIARRTSRKSFIISILVASLMVFSMLGGITTNFETGVSTHTTSSEPALSSKLLSPMNNSQSTLGVNPFYLYSNEPAPMGLADFGVVNPGENGIGETDYSYNTTSFLGAASINSLSAYNNTTINHQMTFQFNVNLAFNYSGNLYVYWVQDVAFVNTSNNCIQFIDNIWNISSPSASMQNSTFTGNGSLGNSSGTYYYYSCANPSLPGNDVKLKYPSNVQFMVNSTVNNGVPEVTLMYNDGYGWVTYDNVLFKFVSNLPKSCDYGFVVDGYNYEPDGYSFYDAELILGGPGGGSSTADIQSNVNLTIQYWNSHNYQEISNAFNFGTDTAETIGNAVSTAYYSTYTGNLFEEVTAGENGSLGQAYSSSDISLLNISMPFSSGTVYVNGSAHSFVGGDINLTLAPGHYPIKIYNNSVLYKSTTVNLSAGEYLPLEVNESLVTFTETGLPSGAIWYVNLTEENGTIIRSGSITLTSYAFELTNGTYSYIIATNDKTYSAPEGSFTVHGVIAPISVSFSGVNYKATFTETGLPSGAIWYVNLSNGQSFHSTTPTISFNEVNGTYSYTIATSSKLYLSLPLSGSLKVNGKSVSQFVTFSKITYTISGYVLPTSASIMFYNTSVSVNSSGYYNISLTYGTYIVSVTDNGYFSYVNSTKINKNMNDLNFTLIKEPKSTSTITASNVTANGYNVIVSSIASSNGSISVNYTATKNGIITVALPCSQVKNATIGDLLSSRLYINGTQYSNFTVAISSSGTAILTVYKLTGDPTLVWLYSPAASPPTPPSPMPKPSPVSSAISSIEIYAIISVVVAIVAVAGAVMVMRKKK